MKEEKKAYSSIMSDIAAGSPLIFGGLAPSTAHSKNIHNNPVVWETLYLLLQWGYTMLHCRLTFCYSVEDGQVNVGLA